MVLHGARETLKSQQPYLLVEIQNDHHDGYHQAQAVFHFLSQLNYKYQLVNKEGLVDSKGTVEEDLQTAFNFFFVPR